MKLGSVIFRTINSALVIIFVGSINGKVHADVVCEKIKQDVDVTEFNQYIDEMVKQGNIPPGEYQPREIERCYIKPESGFVTKKETAVLVAEAIMKEILGNSINFDRRIFEASELPNGNWLVKAYDPSPGVRQRVPMIEINRKDAGVVRLWVD